MNYLALKSESFYLISVVPGLCRKDQHGPQCQDKTGVTWDCVSSVAHTQPHSNASRMEKIRYPSQDFCQFARDLNPYGYRDGMGEEGVWPWRGLFEGSRG